MVRVVSLFLQTFIKAKLINFNSNLISEIQRFCVEFGKVREANDLYKLIATENYIKQQ